MIMGLGIQNNVDAFNARRQLTGTAAKGTKAIEKLSSDYRIKPGAGDAAGLAIEKMRGQTSGLAQAQRKIDASGGVGSKTDDSAAGTNLAGLTLEQIDNAIGNVSTARSELGAVQNRMENSLAKLATYQENLLASESWIRDLDMAAEMVNFTRLQ
jgi:flagellin